MDDISEQIDKILSDPQSMKQLQSMAAALGLGGDTAPQPPEPAATSGLSPEMIQAVTRFAPVLSRLNEEDDSARLLRALRPFLGQERRKKLDEAVKILQLMRLFPILRESGMLSNMFSL